MLTEERKRHILDILAKSGRVVAKDVSRALALSDDTIRRDLRELAAAGKLKRVHGGALPLVPADAPYATRVALRTADKAAIGAYAAGMIAPGQVVFLDGGTTALEVARHVEPSRDARFVTHSPTVALALMDRGCAEIDIIGGRLFAHSIVTRGALALEWIARYRPDVCFIGATGVHPAAGITTGDGEEAAVKRAIIKQSGSSYILASSEKLGAMASFQIASVDDIDGVIAVTTKDPAHTKILDQLTCEVSCAEGASSD